MFNAHVLTYLTAKWKHHKDLALISSLGERVLHNRNAVHWATKYIDEWHRSSSSDIGMIPGWEGNDAVDDQAPAGREPVVA